MRLLYMKNILKRFIFGSEQTTTLCTHQEGLVKLKGAWKLSLQLVNTVQPLQEDGAALVHVLRVFSVAAAVCKFMAKVQPLCLHQNLETLRKDVTRSQTQLNVVSQWHNIFRTIPMTVSFRLKKNVFLRAALEISLLLPDVIVRSVFMVFCPQHKHFKLVTKAVFKDGTERSRVFICTSIVR